MHEIDNRWESGEVSVAEEHFATGILRGRMLSLARNWGAGSGPLALLACPPGEQQDLGFSREDLGELLGSSARARSG
jgi:hypothetical protein